MLSNNPTFKNPKNARNHTTFTKTTDGDILVSKPIISRKENADDISTLLKTEDL